MIGSGGTERSSADGSIRDEQTGWGEYHRAVGISRGAGLVVVALLVLGLACSRPPEGRRYPLTGQVLAVHTERNEILIRHEEIPGFMDAMTMPFGVKDPKLLAGRIPGDVVRGTLFVGETTTYLEALEKTGFGPVPSEGQPRGTLPLVEPGHPVGDISLVDQQGKKRTLSEFRGKVLAITFIFTRCPMPEFCPALDRGFARLHASLAKDRDLAARVQLLTISFDPEHDTSEVLTNHARKVGADGTSWVFATGAAADVDRFGASLGLEVIRDPKTGITHNLRTALVDPEGNLGSVVSGADWKTEDVLSELRRLARGAR